MENALQPLATYISEQYSPTAAPGYLTIIQRYLGYMGEKALRASYTDVLNYIGYLRQLKLHPKTLVNHLFCLKIYYRWLLATAQRSDHPCQSLYLKDAINKRIPVESLYSKQTLEELLQQHQNKHALLQSRDEVIISLLIYQALSVQEMAALNLADVNLKAATIQAKGGHKQKARTLSLQANQILLLHRYLSEDRGKIVAKYPPLTLADEAALILGNVGNRIYPGLVNKLINTNRGKQEKLLPLKIRQSVIAHLLKSNHDVRIVQVFAGHKRTGSTEEYQQTGLEELKTIIQKLHPLQ